MALDKNGLKTALKAIFSAQRDPETAAETAADELADAIETFVKTATVTITALPSEVAVTSASFGPSANASPLTFKGGDATHTGGLS